MNANPLLGVFFHWLGGLASASFYVPFRGVRRWSWEIYWLTGGIFSWLLAPWIIASLRTEDLLAVRGATRAPIVFCRFFFGMVGGLGGLPCGLTRRFLGLSPGVAGVLGLFPVSGPLIPPI